MDADTVIKKTVKPLNYKANNVYTAFITLLFSLFILTNVCILFVSFMLINLIDENVISLFGALYSVNLVLFIICGIFFLLWTYRANKNIRVLNSKYQFEFSPGWSVGAFFIPILNLYWPYKVIKEIRTASLIDEKKATSRTLLLVWWITFLLQNILQRANAARIPMQSELDVRNYFAQSFLWSIFAIISALLAIIITRKINIAQKIRAGNLNTPI